MIHQMPDSNQRPKITVEDLLRLKRAERPDAGFWENFERELREKQLAALLEKRPWWQELPQLLTRRPYIPVGATAILAFTLVSVRYYSPAQLAQVEDPVIDSAALASHRGEASVRRTASDPVSDSAPDRSAVAAPAITERNSYVTTARVQPAGDADEMLALLPAPRESASPSARSIAANLERLEQSEPELVNAVLGSRLSSPVRVKNASLDDLAAVPLNAAKRTRLLAQYTDRQLSLEPATPELVRERLARRLGDSEITDRISRLDVHGAGLALRF